MGSGKDSLTFHAMAVMQATAATTPNSSPARKQAAGKKHQMEHEIARAPRLRRLKGTRKQLGNDRVLIFSGVSRNGKLPIHPPVPHATPEF
jgi:hypothetical protein